MVAPLLVPVQPPLLVPVQWEFQPRRSSNADSPDYSVLNVAIGTPAPDRKLVGFITQRTGNQLGATGLRMNRGSGLENANMITPVGDSNEGSISGAWYWLDVPLGTSIEMFLHFGYGGSHFCFLMYLFAIYGAGNAPVHYHSGDATSGTSIVSPEMDIPAGGLLLSAYSTQGERPSTTWSGATERDDDQVDNDIRASCASAVFEDRVTGHQVTASFLSSGSRIQQSVVWPPA